MSSGSNFLKYLDQVSNFRDIIKCLIPYLDTPKPRALKEYKNYLLDYFGTWRIERLLITSSTAYLFERLVAIFGRISKPNNYMVY